jgi:uncharacterized repeat protein (TIGR03803 family)
VTISGGNLYGGAGPKAVYRISQKGSGWVFNPIYEFTGVPDGLFLSGRMVFGPGGALYGTTSVGGRPDCADGGGCGTVFSLRPPGVFCRTVSCEWVETILYRFNPVYLPTDGYFPAGDLVFDAAGNAYGATSEGGQNGSGTIYQLTRSQDGWAETVFYSFGKQNDGSYPSDVVIDQSGNLYGTAHGGGDPACYSYGCGVVFELTHTPSGWVETILHTFENAADGAFPSGGLVFASSGNLYGTTSHGGSNGGGTVYELTPSSGGWAFKVLYSVNGNGSGPVGRLAMDSSGNLYGATNSEGAYGRGNIFKLAPPGGNWTYTSLHDFFGGSGDGAYPSDSPSVDANGNLFGTAGEGGTGSCSYGCGVVWEITP